MNKRFFVFLFFILLLGRIFGVEQWEIKAPDSLNVGTVFSAELLLPEADPASNLEKSPQIFLPLFDTLPDLSLLDVKVEQEEAGVRLKHQFIFTNSGLVSLPELEFSYTDAKGNDKKIQTESYPFLVHTLLDTTIKDIVDVRAPQSLYLGAVEYSILALAVLIILLLIRLLPILLRKKRESDIEKKIVDNRPAWQVGLESLQKAEEFLQKGELLNFFFELSFSLRFFLERKYDLPATQMTTDELRAVLRLSNMSEHNKLFEIFSYADLVKFAKYVGNISLSRDYCEWAKNLFLADKVEAEKMEKELESELNAEKQEGENV